MTVPDPLILVPDDQTTVTHPPGAGAPAGTPGVPGEIPEGRFVAAVGSFEPEAAELPPALVSVSRVFVDTVEGAREEAGDLIQAQQAGAFAWEDATALEDALRSSERPEGTIVFKSVGDALWDLAAARTAFPSQ